MNKNQLETIEAYNQSAQAFDGTIAKLSNYNHCYDYLIKELPEPGASVLDLACGPANISAYLSEKRNFKLVGLDLSESMLSVAREKLPLGNFQCKSIVDFSIAQSFDLVINGFGLPYLNKEQRKESFVSTVNVMKPGALFFLSFMEGNQRGFETPSFNKEVELYIYYHLRAEVEEELSILGLHLEKSWELDYKESDGSVTTDVVLVLRK